MARAEPGRRGRAVLRCRRQRPGARLAGRQPEHAARRTARRVGTGHGHAVRRRGRPGRAATRALSAATARLVPHGAWLPWTTSRWARWRSGRVSHPVVPPRPVPPPPPAPGCCEPAPAPAGATSPAAAVSNHHGCPRPDREPVQRPAGQLREPPPVRAAGRAVRPDLPADALGLGADPAAGLDRGRIRQPGLSLAARAGPARERRALCWPSRAAAIWRASSPAPT